VTAPSEAQIAAVLGEHERTEGPRDRPMAFGCTCGTWEGYSHRTHVAAVLAALFAERDAEQRREAWDEGWCAGAENFAAKLFEWLAAYGVPEASGKARQVAESFIRDGWTRVTPPTSTDGASR